MYRLVAITGLAVAVGLGCSDGDDGSAPTTSTVESDPTTTTEADQATTTEPVPFEVEVKRAAIELLEIRNDVFQHPDVTRVSEYIAETCVCLERERGFIERFEAEGLRWTAALVEVRGINLTNPDPGGPTLTLVSRQPAAQLVSADGVVSEQTIETSEATYRLSLVRVQGQWRLNGFEGVELNPETIAAVIEEGLP